MTTKAPSGPFSVEPSAAVSVTAGAGSLPPRTSVSQELLRERVKEMDCLQRVMHLLLTDRTLDASLLEELLSLLPLGWTHTELCAARISCGKWEAQTPGFRQTPWRLEEYFRTLEGHTGVLEVVYLEPGPFSPENPFVPEERNLLKAISDIVLAFLNRVRTEASLQESEERYRLVSLATNDVVRDWTLPTGAVWWNDGLHTRFGYEDRRAAGHISWWSERVHPEDRRGVQESLSVALQSSEPLWSSEYRFLRADGTYAEVQDRGCVMRDAEGNTLRMIGTMRDITEQKRAEAEFKDLAYNDPLTRLPNRAALQAKFVQAIEAANANGHELALLLVNLDHFSDINNSLGQDNGDLLLNIVARRLRGALDAENHVASLGGDEFAILLPRLRSRETIDAILAQIHQSLEQPIVLSGIPVKVEATLGIACYPEHGGTMGPLWQHADVALRAARARHEAHLVYSADIDHHDPTRLALIGELRSAIDESQLVLYYQPKIDIRTGHAVALEALIRWQHPARGLVFPDMFIPMAERTSLINPLTAYVIVNALRQGKAFHQQGLELDISVNLSARNLHPGFCKGLLDVVSTVGFPLSRLTLEITETAIMNDPVRAKGILAELNQAGIHLSMDDFGVGQSSLTYLKNLPISKMKIDKSFIMNFDQPHNVAIVRSAIDLGRNMGLQVTAEGVEDESTFLALRELGCDLAQGYYFSKAQPVASLTEWLLNSQWKYQEAPPSNPPRSSPPTA